jgi:small GTP-binding protein
MFEDDENYDMIFKILVIGDTGVGKSNLLLRYVKNEFAGDMRSTVGVEFGTKMMKIDGYEVKAQIWDTAGQERYKAITNAFYKGSKGAFVVYDITRKESFINIDKWIGELKTNGSDDILIVLVGNKTDLEDKREVLTEEVEKKAKQYGIAFCETSALNGQNIEHAFDILIEQILKDVDKIKEKENKNNKNNKKKTKAKGIMLETNNSNNNKNKKSKCCK